MFSEKIQQINKMQEETGNHRDWCVMQVAKSMTDEEIKIFAGEIEKRFGSDNAEILIVLSAKIDNPGNRELVKTEIANWLLKAVRRGITTL